MKKIILITGIVVLIALLLIGLLYFYNPNPTPNQNQSQIPPTNASVSGQLKAMPEKVDDSKASLADQQAVSSANNKFAIDFYKNIKSEEGNLFYSPYSLSTAVSMVYEGAKGNTKEEMKDVFYFPEDSSLRNGNAALYNLINKKDKNYSLSTANALWAEKTYSFLSDYFSTIEQYYGGRVVNMDFIGDTENSRQTINRWVEEQTNSRIKDLLPEGSVNVNTRLVLTNAIYFKGKWNSEFKTEDTRKMDFFGKQTVQADMMYQKEDFNYFENGDLKMLEMDYQGKELSMLVLLPKNNLDELDLTAGNLDSWKSQMIKQEVNVYFPKFKFETKYDLNENLQEMGIKDAFNPGKADFSGMDGTKDLYISKVIHKAFVEVNEEGTEAAAATGIVMGITSAGPTETKEFRADRPFIFIIQEKSTGNILFIGRMENPVA